jgi:hypothetical protein
MASRSRNNILKNLKNIPNITNYHIKVVGGILSNNKINMYATYRLLGANHITAMVYVSGNGVIREMNNIRRRVKNINNQQISELLSLSILLGKKLGVSPYKIVKRYVFERGINKQNHATVMSLIREHLNKTNFNNMSAIVNRARG